MVAPVLTYLFHRLEERFDGRPTLLILDEAWVFLDHPLFAARIREWLKVLRKKNVAVVFATQSLADIADSSDRAGDHRELPAAHPAAQRPGDRAAEPRAAYERFGLNDRQIELIAGRRPSGIITCSRRAATGCSSSGSGPSRWRCAAPPIPRRQQRIDALLAEHGGAGFRRRASSRPPVSTGPPACSPISRLSNPPEGE